MDHFDSQIEPAYTLFMLFLYASMKKVSVYVRAKVWNMRNMSREIWAMHSVISEIFHINSSTVCQSCAHVTCTNIGISSLTGSIENVFVLFFKETRSVFVRAVKKITNRFCTGLGPGGSFWGSFWVFLCSCTILWICKDLYCKDKEKNSHPFQTGVTAFLLEQHKHICGVTNIKKHRPTSFIADTRTCA